LEVLGVSGDDSLPSVGERDEDSGNKVGETFSDASRSFDDEMVFALERLKKSERHGALLRTKLEGGPRGEKSLLTEDSFDLRGKILHREIIAK
jgi:hypothetical protein